MVNIIEIAICWFNKHLLKASHVPFTCNTSQENRKYPVFKGYSVVRIVSNNHNSNIKLFRCQQYQKTSHILTHWFLTRALWNKRYYYSYFMDERTENGEGKSLPSITRLVSRIASIQTQVVQMQSYTLTTQSKVKLHWNKITDGLWKFAEGLWEDLIFERYVNHLRQSSQGPLERAYSRESQPKPVDCITVEGEALARRLVFTPRMWETSGQAWSCTENNWIQGWGAYATSVGDCGTSSGWEVSHDVVWTRVDATVR